MIEEKVGKTPTQVRYLQEGKKKDFPHFSLLCFLNGFSIFFPKRTFFHHWLQSSDCTACTCCRFPLYIAGCYAKKRIASFCQTTQFYSGFFPLWRHLAATNLNILTPKWLQTFKLLSWTLNPLFNDPIPNNILLSIYAPNFIDLTLTLTKIKKHFLSSYYKMWEICTVLHFCCHNMLKAGLKVQLSQVNVKYFLNWKYRFISKFVEYILVYKKKFKSRNLWWFKVNKNLSSLVASWM